MKGEELKFEHKQEQIEDLLHGKPSSFFLLETKVENSVDID